MGVEWRCSLLRIEYTPSLISGSSDKGQRRHKPDVLPGRESKSESTHAESTAAIANLPAVALFPGVSACDAHSMSLEDGFFASLVFDAICSLLALFRIHFIVPHEPRFIDCLIKILWNVNRKRSYGGRDQSSLLSFAERYDIAFDNCGRLITAIGLTQMAP